MFVLDFIPTKYLPEGAEEKSVMIFTAGWAMKFIPLLGRALMEMAFHGDSHYKLKQFRIDREDTDKDKSVIKKTKIEGEGTYSCFTMEGQARGSSLQYRHVEDPLEA